MGFWPVMVWHGEGGPTGTDWRWDIHSTVAEAVYLGVVGFVVLMAWLGNRPAGRLRPPKGRLRVEATTPEQLAPPPASIIVTPPSCCHLDAVPVDLSTGERVAWWCEACETQLDEDFGRLVRPCCGSAPGTPHVYNCPNWKEQPS